MTRWVPRLGTLAVCAGLLAGVTRADPASPTDRPTPPLTPARVVLYHGYGTPSAVRLRGRVLEQRPPRDDPAQGAVANVVDAVRVLETDEAKGVPVELRVLGKQLGVLTDDDGLFDLPLTLDETPFPVGVQPFSAHLLPRTTHVAPAADGLVFVVPDAPVLLAISDFDDTICNTYVKDKPRMLVEVFTKNRAQLTPVTGAPAAYRAAQRAGVKGFFYVSGSPLALWDRLDGFLVQHQFPRGPLFLKNLGDDDLFAHDEYKVGRITAIIEAFPRARFVLIGDSGERDPEIYATVRARFGPRVHAIVVRRAPGGDDNPARFVGVTVVDDYKDDPEAIARLVRTRRAPVKTRTSPQP